MLDLLEPFIGCCEATDGSARQELAWGLDHRVVRTRMWFPDGEEWKLVLEGAFYRDTTEAPQDTVTEVRFEDLEQLPIEQLRRIYAELDLEWTAAYQQRLENYLAGLAGYQKTRHKTLTDTERQQIRSTMLPFMRRWGYDAEDVAAGKAA